MLPGRLALPLVELFDALQSGYPLISCRNSSIPSVCRDVSTPPCARFPYLIVAPTMRVPGNVSQSANAYLAMRALLVAVSNHNAVNAEKIHHLAIPSLCTGIGAMCAKESARQMRAGFDNIVCEGWRNILHPAMAPFVDKSQ